MRLSPELARACLRLTDAPPDARPVRHPDPTPPAAGYPWLLAFTVPVKVVSRPNRRDHWAAAHRRNGAEANALAAALRTLGLDGVGMHLLCPLAVRLTRLHRGRDMDTDNLAGAHKAIRDALAAWLGIDDGSPLVRWSYAQERAKVPACRVEVSSVTTQEA